MKKYLLLFLTFKALFSLGQTNLYHEFPEQNANWNFNYFGGCLSGNDIENYSIEISGDTLINTQLYHKWNIPFIQLYLAGSCIQTNSIGYKGAFRQDLLLKKVFYVPPFSSSEELLYDFNLQVGDTVEGFLEAFANPKDTVISIDSILIGNNYRKRWNINSCYNISIIEGIGSTYGLLMPSFGCITDVGDCSLTCFQENGQSLYPDSGTSCQLITSNNNENNSQVPIVVFPNPSMGYFSIAIPYPSIKEITLTDMLGKILFIEKTFNQKVLNISNLESGTYLLRIITNDNKVINQKIISSP